MSFSPSAFSPSNTLGQVQNGRDYLDTLVNKYVLKPAHAKGINGFVFDYEGETSVRLSSDITDHYTEKNDPIQDQIANRPERIVLRGLIGELVVRAPQGVTGLLSTVKSKLTTVDAYLGKYTPGAIAKIQNGITKAQNVVNTVDEDLARARNVVDMFKNAVNLASGAPSADKMTKQRGAYIVLATLRNTKQPCTVETPFHYYENMYIEDLSFVQEDQVSDYSDIIVCLKQLRFAVVSKPNPKLVNAGVAAHQRQDKTRKGKTNGTQVDVVVVQESFSQ